MPTFFHIKCLLIIAICASILSALYLIVSQLDKAENDYSALNPKFVTPKKRPLNVTNSPAKPKPIGVPMERKPEVSEVEGHGTAAIRLAEKGRPPSIHIFYYPWYGNPKYDDGKYYHWNHKYLPHWDQQITNTFPRGQHQPPSDIGANFYPKLGAYSSRDTTVIEQHMKWISSSGIDVIVVSWYYPGTADENGYPWDDLIPSLLDAAKKYRLMLTFHMEPYKGRNATTLRRDIEYVIKTYGTHPAFYRRLPAGVEDKKDVKREPLPLLYFYDAYLLPKEEWQMLTKPSGKLSVRGTAYDAIFIGLLVSSSDRHTLLESGFDGLYTYFASDGFSYGSTPSNWPSLTAFCRKKGLLFVPSVGPGYDDTRVRPWNEKNTKNRADGEYYKRMFQMAHTARADIVSITSFNEWHEGTQIEPAIPFTDSQTNFTYEHYGKGPEQYLHLTLDLINEYFVAAHQIAPAKIANIV